MEREVAASLTRSLKSPGTMDIITRKEAKAQGLPRYFTGKPCKHGHIAERQTSKGVCEECHRLHRTSEKAHVSQKKRYSERMATDESFRQAKRDDAIRHYHNVMKHDEERMRKHYEKCAEYRKTDASKASMKKAMIKFVESGKKAESDRRYAATPKGKEAAKRGNKAYMERIAEEHGSYTKWRYERNPHQKVHNNLNSRIRVALFSAQTRKAHKTEELIGCTIKELMSRFEMLFQPGMTWENYGRNGWHIDHIKPCDAFDLMDEAQQKECFHWSNLQPLWEADYIRKGAKWEAA